MKTLGLFSLSILFSLSAQAGLPSEDPAVAKVREQFQQGKTPSMEELKLGQRWACKSHNAIKGYNDVYSGQEYQFVADKKIDGTQFFIEQIAAEHVRAGRLDISETAMVYALNGGNFLGQPYEDPTLASVHLFGRIAQDGSLIMEIASLIYPELPEVTKKRRLSISEPATIFPELRLMGFDVCQVKQ